MDQLGRSYFAIGYYGNRDHLQWEGTSRSPLPTLSKSFPWFLPQPFLLFHPNSSSDAAGFHLYLELYITTPSQIVLPHGVASSKILLLNSLLTIYSNLSMYRPLYYHLYYSYIIGIYHLQSPSSWSVKQSIYSIAEHP